MKRILPYSALLVSILISVCVNAQVTKIAGSVTGPICTLTNRMIVYEDNSGQKLGSTDGTSPIEQFGSTLTIISSFFTVYHDKLYFLASSTAGQGVYATDGTDAGTYLVTKKIQGFPRNPIVANNLLFLEGSAADGSYQLWETNGTDAGTKIVKIIAKGLPAYDYPFAKNNTVFFAADDGVNGGGLWKTDGTEAGTVLVKAIPSTDPHYYENYGLGFIDSVNDKAIFTLNNGGTWATDGSPGGTVQLPANLMYSSNLKLNNAYYFTATSPTSPNYTALWSTDGTVAGTAAIQDSTNLASNKCMILNGKIIGVNKAELDVLDGTPNGAVVIDSFPNVPADEFAYGPVTLFTAGNNVFKKNEAFFIGKDSTHGSELWTTDGTAGNTRIVKDIYPGATSSFDLLTFDDFGYHHQQYVSYYYTAKGIYFAANDSLHGMELWQSDGTEAGTRMVKDINAGSDDSDPEFVGIFKNHLYFLAVDSGYAGYSTPRNLFFINTDTSSLPVSLAAFTAVPVKLDVQLNWVTSTEINTSHFNIQRSEDGGSFKDIGIVQAAGNSSVTESYQYTDINALSVNASVLFYRLQTNDKDGKVAYSRIISIPVKEGSGSIAIYPNPAKNMIQLTYTLQDADVRQTTVRIINTEGKTVLNSQLGNLQGSNKATVDIATLAAGIYYVQVITGKNIQNSRFVKQ